MSSENSNRQDQETGPPQHVGVPEQEPGTLQGTVVLRVDGLAAGGRGVGRLSGEVWFVEGAMPGDLVRASPVRRHRRHVEALAVAIVEPSAARRTPPCPIQGLCGGCPWMPLHEPAQREWKMRLLRNALERIGRVPTPAVDPVRTPSASLGYRNRVEFTVRCGGGRPARVGLHAASGRALVDVERCLLQDDAANAVLSTAREFFAEALVRRGPRVELRLAIRRAERGGGMLVALRETGQPFRAAEALARFLAGRHPLLTGVVLLRGAPGRRGGTRTRVLAGRDRLEEGIGSFHLELPAASFAQVSAAGAEELLRLVADLAMPVSGRSAIDLYGGVGLFGMELARRGASPVTVCDADADAIAGGRRAAAAAGLAAVRHEHADAARFLAERSGTVPDVLVANPPRSGLGPGVARAILTLGPARLILVSCDPATLARDLGILAREGAYRVERLVPLDLFPQTAHLETVALLGRTLTEWVPPQAPPGGPRPRAPGSG